MKHRIAIAMYSDPLRSIWRRLAWREVVFVGWLLLLLVFFLARELGVTLCFLAGIALIVVIGALVQIRRKKKP